MLKIRKNFNEIEFQTMQTHISSARGRAPQRIVTS